ncbi:hypothetical protein Krad_1713 [Kineococcus radiotolerans SRS30216 = ATCC BAA-149]|uniref:Uncharacterized protein n=2 Tax=Kineococcus radiotolerans TaxID=131568 RepID=A6W8R0_KINRD|nr:hypothetical protein Krad_1713 [Kineococcus radiotolerans SRS30216 = ATCC BAA-149]
MTTGGGLLRGGPIRRQSSSAHPTAEEAVMHGTFTKDGVTKVAQDPAHRTLLIFTGWGEVDPATLKGASLAAAVEAAGVPNEGTADDKRVALRKATQPS